MSRRARLDAELVRRGLARSREHAADLVAAGHVTVPGRATVKPATQVDAGEAIQVAEDEGASYVSRGGHKLAGALDAFGPRGLLVAGRRCLDAGASTGGFTECCCAGRSARRRRRRRATASSPGRCRPTSGSTVRDRTNVRDLDAPRSIGGRPTSWSLTCRSSRCASCCPPWCVVDPDADLVLMVKPQFEVGRERLGAGGVVREPELRAARSARSPQRRRRAWPGCAGCDREPVARSVGNVEYFMWLRRGAAPVDLTDVRRAVEEGPS